MQSDFQVYTLPSGRRVRVPSGISEEDVLREVRRVSPQDLDPAYDSPSGPGVIARPFTSFAESFQRGIQGIAPGIEAGFGAAINDDERYQSAVRELEGISQSAGQLNQDPSSFGEVREKYNTEGMGSALMELVDLGAQGIGSSLGRAAPSLALLGAAYTAPVSGPVVLAAIGGAGLINFAQFFSEQIERQFTEARDRGEEIHEDDVNVAKHAALAVGQAALDSASLLTSGILGKIVSRPLVMNAMNTATAKSVQNLIQSTTVGSFLGKVGATALTEAVTESGQTAFERAAAGLPVAPEDQKDFDEYIETVVTSLLVGGAFGAVGGAGDIRTKAKEKSLPPETSDQPVEPRAQEVVKPPPPPDIDPEGYLAEVTAPIAAINQEQAAQVEQGAAAELAQIQQTDRTPLDIQNLLDAKNIDYSSKPEAAAGIGRLVFETTGKTDLRQLTPDESEAVYARIDALPRNEIARPLPAATLNEAVNAAAYLPKKARSVSPTQLAQYIRGSLAKESSLMTDDKYINARVKAITDKLTSEGIVELSANKRFYKIDRPSIDFFHNSELRRAAEDLIAIAQNDISENGNIPSFKKAKEMLGIRSKSGYDSIIESLKRRGLIEPADKKETKYKLKDQAGKHADLNLVDYSRSDVPVSRWVVRDKTSGKVARTFPSRSKARSFLQGQPKDNNFDSPKQETGYLVRENQLAPESRKIRKSKPVGFIPSTDLNAEAAADTEVSRMRDSRLEEFDSLGAKAIDETEVERTTSRGKTARLRKLARSKDPVDRQRALRELRANPFSIDSVTGKYSLGDLAPGAMENINETVDISVPVDINGNTVANPIPVTVKSGHYNPDGDIKGFGKARLDQELPGWPQMISEFFNKIKNNPNILNNGEIVIYPEAPGRLVGIWMKPDGTEPFTVAMDYYEENGNPYYHIYNAFTGDNGFTQAVEDFTTRKGMAPKRGEPSVQALKAAADPKNAKKLNDAQKAAQDVEGYDYVAKAAAKFKQANLPPKKPPTGFLGLLNRAADRFMGPDAFGRLRMEGIHEFDPGFKAEEKIEHVDPGVEMLADMRAGAAMINIHNIVPMGQSAMTKGFVEYHETDAETMSGVSRVVDFELSNDSGDINIYDPTNKQYRKFRAKGNMFNEERGNKTGGLVTVWSALSEVDHEKISKLYNYLRGLRAYNLKNAGKKVPLSTQQIENFMAIPLEDPEIAIAYRNVMDLNEKLIDWLYDTKVLGEEGRNFWKQNRDYTPFLLDLDHESNAFIQDQWKRRMAHVKGSEKLLGSLIEVDPSKPYTGIGQKKPENANDTSYLVDPLTATLTNMYAILTAGQRNIARLRSIRDQVTINAARPIDPDFAKQNNIETVTAKYGDKELHYVVDDTLLHEMLQGTKARDLVSMFHNNPLLRFFFVTPSKVLRESVTRNPGFIAPNMLRDSLSVWLTNGGSPLLVAKVMNRAAGNIAKMRSGEYTQAKKELSEQGVTGGFDNVKYQGTPDRAAKKLDKKLRKMQKNRNRGAAGKTFDAMEGLWDALGEASGISESATRELVYEHVYLQTLEKLANRTDLTERDKVIIAKNEGLHQAQEILNFTRRGSNNIAQLVFSLAPFMNARIQGMDVIARRAFKYRKVGYVDQDATRAQWAMVRRGMTIAGISAVIAALNFDDDEYERQPGYARDMNWYVPLPGTESMLKFPIPFELGLVFKTLPEQIVRSALLTMRGEGGQAARDGGRALWHALVDTFGLTPAIPVVARPGIERLSNRSLWTGVPIESYYEQGKDPEDRFGPQTSAQARMISNLLPGFLNISPKYIDNEIRTLAGGLGVYGWAMLDHLLRMPGYVSKDWAYQPRPTPRMSDVMLIRRFIADEFGTGERSAFYEMKRIADKATQALAEASPRDRAKVYRENKAELRLAADLKPIYKTLNEIRKQKNELVDNARSLSGSELRDRLDRLERREFAPLARFRAARKRYDSSR